MQANDIIKKVRQIEIRTRKRTDRMFFGQYHSTFKGQGVTFSEIRSYEFGDDIRRIDWNKTARFNEAFVKITEEERELSILLAVDISSSMNYGTRSQTKLEYIAEICATLGFSAMRNNDKVGLILFADKVYKVIPPRKGKKHILKIIGSILNADHISTKVNMSDAMLYLVRVFKKKSAVFLFSDFNDDLDSTSLRTLSGRHELLSMGIYDQKDTEIPDIGYALFTDSETGEKYRVNTSDRIWQREFTEKRSDKIQKTEDFFKKGFSSFIKLHTNDDYRKALYDYFRKR